MKLLSPKKWAVVQDLRPFGYRVEKVYRSKQRAERRSRLSRFLTVILVDEARDYNRCTEDLTEFDKELAAYDKRRTN